MTKKPWIPPQIHPHQVGGMNKFGRPAARDQVMSTIDGVSVLELTERFGSPLFVTSERRLRYNARRLKETFERQYEHVVHGWSYKTNYTSAICNVLHQEGSWAEVVSEFEYEKARYLGVPGDRILFNGPRKSARILERAIAEGAHIHLDHFEELDTVEGLAQRMNRIVPVTLRLNFATSYTEPWSRFGFCLDNGEALAAARILTRSPHLRLNGLHSHIGTFITEPRAYDEQVARMGAFMAELEADGEVMIETIDLGGGLPSRSSLKGTYLSPGQSLPSLDEYAETIGRAMRSATEYRRLRGQGRPRLVIESGRAVVDDTQWLVSTVVGTKQLPDGRRGAVLDAGVNLMFTAYWYHPEVKLAQPLAGTPEETVLFGPLCMNIDVVRESVTLPPLSAGHQVVLGPVGAYNNTQWQQFIEYRPAIVMLAENGTPHLIREAENLAVMCAQDRLPKHLAQPFPLDRALRQSVIRD